MIYILQYLKDPFNYRNYGIFLISSSAGFLSSTLGTLLTTGITAYSLLWVVQDIYHQP